MPMPVPVPVPVPVSWTGAGIIISATDAAMGVVVSVVVATLSRRWTCPSGCGGVPVPMPVPMLAGSEGVSLCRICCGFSLLRHAAPRVLNSCTVLIVRELIGHRGAPRANLPQHGENVDLRVRVQLIGHARNNM